MMASKFIIHMKTCPTKSEERVLMGSFIVSVSVPTLEKCASWIWIVKDKCGPARGAAVQKCGATLTLPDGMPGSLQPNNFQKA